MKTIHRLLLALSTLLLSVTIVGITCTLADEVIPDHSTVLTGTPSEAEPDQLPPASSAGTPSEAEPEPVIPQAVLPQLLSDEGCGTLEELVQQLLDKDTATISLSSDIDWSYNREVTVVRPKMVEMGEFQITVAEENSFNVTGPVTFTGNNDNSALFEIRGSFHARDGVEIRARGDGITGIKIDGGRWEAENIKIYAGGSNAQAVHITGSNTRQLHFCKIQATGNGSCGLNTEEPLELYLSSISGGETAVLSNGGTSLAYSCRLTPSQDDITIISADCMPYTRLEENGICLSAGSRPDELRKILSRHVSISYQFYSEQMDTSILYSVPAVWSGLPSDLSSPGSHMAHFSPDKTPEWFPVSLRALDVPIHIVGPESPFIMDAQDADEAVILRFFTPIHDAEDFFIEYSTDNGKNWRNAADFSSAYITNELASIEPLDPDRTYLFRLIVNGGPMEGVSNEILFINDELRRINGGGDRDHDDRGNQGDKPPHGDIIPPSSHGTGSGKPVRPETTSAPEESAPPEPTPGPEESVSTEPMSGPEELSSMESTPAPEGPFSTKPPSAQEGSAATKPPSDAEGPAATNSAHPSVQEIDSGPLSSSEPEQEEKPDSFSPRSTVPAVDAKDSAPDETGAWGNTPAIPFSGALTWILLPGILILGGGLYACWYKYKNKK